MDKITIVYILANTKEHSNLQKNQQLIIPQNPIKKVI